MKIRSRSSTTWVFAITVALALLAVLVVGLVWLLYRVFTVESSDWFLTSEARKNQWLAISTLGENYEVTIDSNWNLAEEMPPIEDTVILEDIPSAIVDSTVSTKLEHWVLQGGTLIYQVPMLYDENNPLYATVTQQFPGNFMVFEDFENSIFDFLNQRTGRTKLDCSTNHGTVLFGDGDVAILDWQSRNRLDTSQSPYADDLKVLAPNQLLSMEYGAGTVYFVKDLYLWTNQLVDCADNAYIFMRMVDSTFHLMPKLLNDVAVWIVPSRPLNTPNLLKLTWNNYHFAIIGALLTFAIAIVSHNLRSTPPVHAVPLPRRATVDYVTSVSEFAWRKNEIESFFRAFVWVAENSRGVFGPQTPADSNRIQHTGSKEIDSQSSLNLTPNNEMDLVVNVQKLQSTLRANMHQSIRKS